MRKFLLILPLLTLLSVAQAEDEVAAQFISYGVSPAGVCETFDDSAIPADYKRVKNCDVVEDDDRNTSLYERLLARFNSKNRIQVSADADVTDVSAKYRRLGRGAFTKQAVTGDLTIYVHS